MLRVIGLMFGTAGIACSIRLAHTVPGSRSEKILMIATPICVLLGLGIALWR